MQLKREIIGNWTSGVPSANPTSTPTICYFYEVSLTDNSSQILGGILWEQHSIPIIKIKPGVFIGDQHCG